MFKACSKCGRIHPADYVCTKGNRRTDTDNIDRKMRSLYRWTEKSKQIREEALFCEVCVDEGIYNYSDLEVHHIEKLRDNPDRLLDDENLICLCAAHHRMADRGDLDKDYLLKLASKRLNR